MKYIQLEIEFTWPDFSTEEIRKIPRLRWRTDEHFVVVNLVTGLIFTFGELFYCKRRMMEAKEFYSKYVVYSQRPEDKIHYQLIGFPELH